MYKRDNGRGHEKNIYKRDNGREHEKNSKKKRQSSNEHNMCVGVDENCAWVWMKIASPVSPSLLST